MDRTLKCTKQEDLNVGGKRWKRIIIQKRSTGSKESSVLQWNSRKATTDGRKKSMLSAL